MSTPTAARFVCLSAFYSLLLAQQASHAAELPSDGKLRIIAFGAHPDDCELRVAGVALKWRALGHHVKFVSVTNGDIGHWQVYGEPLAQRRLAEVREAARRLGIETEVMDNHDGELEPTLENRRRVTRLIRGWRADLVLTHRPNDYHPDHRAVGQLLQDSAFMVTVPFFCPETPFLKQNPVFMYYADRFQKPNPFVPDVVVDIDDVFEKKIDAIDALVSQMYEGGASGSEEYVRRVPSNPTERQAWLAEQRPSSANPFRKRLVEWYGRERGVAVKHAEAFETCEYGRQPDREELKKLFPFFSGKNEKEETNR